MAALWETLAFLIPAINSAQQVQPTQRRPTPSSCRRLETWSQKLEGSKQHDDNDGTDTGLFLTYIVHVRGQSLLNNRNCRIFLREINYGVQRIVVVDAKRRLPSLVIFADQTSTSLLSVDCLDIVSWTLFPGHLPSSCLLSIRVNHSWL